MDLNGLKAAADQQARQQVELATSIQRAIDNPAKVTTLNMAGVAAAKDESGRLVVMFALPTGERIDVPLVEGARRALLKGLEDADKR